MAQEFVIKSTNLEDKINQLLPSQGGQQAGIDLSASTMVVPIVDLTESAEGSSLRQDLQTALSLTSNTSFIVSNTDTTIVTTTGYYRIIATFRVSNTGTGSIQVTDGVTTKNLVEVAGSATAVGVETIDVNVFVKAGDSIIISSSSTNISIRGSSRQIADINGNLTNPL